DHRADRQDPIVEYVEGQCADDLVVAIAEDRARLAVHLAWIYSRVDLGERREGRGEHAGNVVGTDHASRQRGRLASPVPDHLDVGSEQLPQSGEVAVPERVEEPRR